MKTSKYLAMNKEDWGELLTHVTKLIIQKAEEEVEGEFPSPQEIREKIIEFKDEIKDLDDYIVQIKASLIDYASKRVRVH